MRLPIYTAAFTGLMAGPALAADLELSLEIPRLTVAEYHRPYVAVWIENQDKTAVKTLAVWYDVKLKNQEGQKWLKDMRQWWRRAGRDMSLPADGVSAATRAPGKHQVVFKGVRRRSGTCRPASTTSSSKRLAKSAASRWCARRSNGPLRPARRPPPRGPANSAP